MALAPPALRPGDLVHLVAPSGPFDRARFERGKAVLEARGYRVTHRADVFDVERYLAGGDARRLEELQAAFDDPRAAAVWAARGGYGAMRLLPHLDLSGLRARPKALVGFSDITALHALLNGAGLASFHGPMVCRLAEDPADAIASLWQCLERPGAGRPVAWEALTPITPGVATGPLLGGNLSVLTRLVGTPYLPPLDGAILLVEDVGERPYRLDRMLTHLELAGLHRRLAGVVVGELTGCVEPGADYGAEEVVAERLAAWRIPAAMGLPVGHGARNLAVPLGLPLTLDAGAGRLEWRDPAAAA